MIIAHLPAGYLLHRSLTRGKRLAPGLLWLSLAGSVFPDIDLLYFYGPGHRHVLHHRYWTHLPAVWLAIALGLWLLSQPEALRWLRWPSGLFVGNVTLHLVLDTMVGGIYWAWPFSWHCYRLRSVPAWYQPSLMNFVFDRSFVVELAICAVAVVVAWRARRQASAGTHPQERPAAAGLC